MLRKEKKISRIRAVQMDNFRGLLSIRRIDKVPNPQIRELCGVMKGVEERIDKGILWWFGNVERMKNDRIALRVYVEECAGNYSACRPWKRWIDYFPDI